MSRKVLSRKVLSRNVRHEKSCHEMSRHEKSCHEKSVSRMDAPLDILGTLWLQAISPNGRPVYRYVEVVPLRDHEAFEQGWVYRGHGMPRLTGQGTNIDGHVFRYFVRRLPYKIDKNERQHITHDVMEWLSGTLVL